MDAGKPVWRLLVAQWLDSRNILKDKLTGFPDWIGVRGKRGAQMMPRLILYWNDFQARLCAL